MEFIPQSTYFFFGGIFFPKRFLFSSGAFLIGSPDSATPLVFPVGAFLAIFAYFQHGLLEIITGFKIFSFWGRRVSSRDDFAFLQLTQLARDKIFPHPGWDFSLLLAFFILPGLVREGFPKKLVFLVESLVIFAELGDPGQSRGGATRLF